MTDTAAGFILHLQRLSTEDGPGLRTTVFYKGCPLACQWCHNPESISPRPQVQWIAARCIGCASCIEACPVGALKLTESGLLRDRAICTVCGDCVGACPTGAMELLGRSVAADELAKELFKDRAYFKKYGGGVTLSGGEPTLQPRFTHDLLAALKGAGLHTALDTCALCSPAVLADLYPLADLFLVDLKLIDPAEHKAWTGAPLEPILANLRWLAGQIRNEDSQKKLWLRTPLIPGATCTRENLAGISAFLKAELDDCIGRWEMCAFNNLCRDKYARLDMEWRFQTAQLMTRTELDQALTWTVSGGFDPKRTFVTGAAKTED